MNPTLEPQGANTVKNTYSELVRENDRDDIWLSANIETDHPLEQKVFKDAIDKWDKEGTVEANTRLLQLAEHALGYVQKDELRESFYVQVRESKVLCIKILKEELLPLIVAVSKFEKANDDYKEARDARLADKTECAVGIEPPYLDSYTLVALEAITKKTGRDEYSPKSAIKPIAVFAQMAMEDFSKTVDSCRGMDGEVNQDMLETEMALKWMNPTHVKDEVPPLSVHKAIEEKLDKVLPRGVATINEVRERILPMLARKFNENNKRTVEQAMPGIEVLDKIFQEASHSAVSEQLMAVINAFTEGSGLDSPPTSLEGVRSMFERYTKGLQGDGVYKRDIEDPAVKTYITRMLTGMLELAKYKKELRDKNIQASRELPEYELLDDGRRTPLIAKKFAEKANDQNFNPRNNVFDTEMRDTWTNLGASVYMLIATEHHLTEKALGVVS